MNPFAMVLTSPIYLAAYSRDQEREADRGGQSMAAGGRLRPRRHERLPREPRQRRAPARRRLADAGLLRHAPADERAHRVDRDARAAPRLDPTARSDARPRGLPAPPRRPRRRRGSGRRRLRERPLPAPGSRFHAARPRRLAVREHAGCHRRHLARRARARDARAGGRRGGSRRLRRRVRQRARPRRSTRRSSRAARSRSTACRRWSCAESRPGPPAPWPASSPGSRTTGASTGSPISCRAPARSARSAAATSSRAASAPLTPADRAVDPRAAPAPRDGARGRGPRRILAPHRQRLGRAAHGDRERPVRIGAARAGPAAQDRRGRALRAERGRRSPSPR